MCGVSEKADFTVWKAVLGFSFLVHWEEQNHLWYDSYKYRFPRVFVINALYFPVSKPLISNNQCFKVSKCSQDAKVYQPAGSRINLSVDAPAPLCLDPECTHMRPLYWPV